MLPLIEPKVTPWHTRRERGHKQGLAVVAAIARIFGRRAVHAFLAPIAVYFVLVRPTERQASRQFLSRVLGRPARISDVFRHFHTFARVAVDREFLLSPRGHSIPLRVTGQDAMIDTLRQGRACILLSAHLGSFEAARQFGLMNSDMRLRLLLDRQINRDLIARFERIDPLLAAGIIDASEEPRTLTLKIGECLRAGEWVGWLGDRYRAGERTATAAFLGSPARFPTSPFIIAKVFRVPVFLVLAGLTDEGYEIFVETLVNDKDLAAVDRDTFLQERVELFAEKLGHYAHRMPYNWFNFYDFWDS